MNTYFRPNRLSNDSLAKTLSKITLVGTRAVKKVERYR